MRAQTNQRRETPNAPIWVSGPTRPKTARTEGQPSLWCVLRTPTQRTERRRCLTPSHRCGGLSRIEMAIEKSSGQTRTEQYLSHLCDRTFLNLWSYANPYKADGKEL